MPPQTAEQLPAVQILQDLWQTHRESLFSLGFNRYTPIAGSGTLLDLPVPDALAHVANPYWDTIRWMPARERMGSLITRRDDDAKTGVLLDPATYIVLDHRTVGDMLTTRQMMEGYNEAGLNRDHMTLHYAWAIPSPFDVAWLAKEFADRPMLEVGAGNGYWAWLLAQAGVDIIATDPSPLGAEYDEGQIHDWHPTFAAHLPAARYMAVEQLDAVTAVHEYPGRVLMMIWPTYRGSWAAEALRAYQGDTVVFAGEGPGGCTADMAFYKHLVRNFEKVHVSLLHGTWEFIHCELSVWKRLPEHAREALR